MIKRGDADVMLAGGSEACITPSVLSGFAALTALSTRNDDPQKASRPFDKNRDGFVFSEGILPYPVEIITVCHNERMTFFNYRFKLPGKH